MVSTGSTLCAHYDLHMAACEHSEPCSSESRQAAEQQSVRKAAEVFVVKGSLGEEEGGGVK